MGFDPTGLANVPDPARHFGRTGEALSLAQVIEAWRHDEHLTEGQVNELIAVGTHAYTARHPLVTASDRRLASAVELGILLDLKWLTRWMANRSNL